MYIQHKYIFSHTYMYIFIYIFTQCITFTFHISRGVCVCVCVVPACMTSPLVFSLLKKVHSLSCSVSSFLVVFKSASALKQKKKSVLGVPFNSNGGIDFFVLKIDKWRSWLFFSPSDKVFEFLKKGSTRIWTTDFRNFEGKHMNSIRL